MKIKTSELEGTALDWAVCEAADFFKAQRTTPKQFLHIWKTHPLSDPWFHPSTDWSQGGPIIERMMLDSGLVLQRNANRRKKETCCVASLDSPVGFYFGPTPLIAVMRCYVASKLGNEVEIPEELLK